MSLTYAETSALFRKYFTLNETQCKATLTTRFADAFPDALVRLREAYAKPMPVISCCRSSAHNSNVGGAPGSLHIYDTREGTCAVDVSIQSGSERAALIKTALDMGWSVGVKQGMVHLDCRTLVYPNDPQVLFLYSKV